MPRAATDVMQSILFSAVLDAVAALKTASKGLPNQLLRDVQAIHNNVTMPDLPKEVQDAITASTRAAFAALLKEGYSVAPKDGGPSRPPLRQGELVQRGGDRPSRPAAPRGPRGPRSDGPRGPRSGGQGGAPRGHGPRGPKPTR